ncbi:MAG: hypothetical protein BWY87_01380 [Deltaproteobacteria bacterium ADurb.Bin510]|nr:MAG: hypothetical protein BWY87_01380 [Deltaproteobacteria bacterium ADurb.Bin510]
MLDALVVLGVQAADAHLEHAVADQHGFFLKELRQLHRTIALGHAEDVLAHAVKNVLQNVTLRLHEVGRHIAHALRHIRATGAQQAQLLGDDGLGHLGVGLGAQVGDLRIEAQVAITGLNGGQAFAGRAVLLLLDVKLGHAELLAGDQTARHVDVALGFVDKGRIRIELDELAQHLHRLIGQALIAIEAPQTVEGAQADAEQAVGGLGIGGVEQAEFVVADGGLIVFLVAIVEVAQIDQRALGQLMAGVVGSEALVALDRPLVAFALAELLGLTVEHVRGFLGGLLAGAGRQDQQGHHGDVDLLHTSLRRVMSDQALQSRMLPRKSSIKPG